jgi:hypothetical protein
MKKAWNISTCGRLANCACAALSVSLVIVLVSFNVQALAQEGASWLIQARDLSCLTQTAQTLSI